MKRTKPFFCFIDFGSSFDLDIKDKKPVSFVSINYSAPEQNTDDESFSSKKKKKKIEKKKFKNKGDVYSLGATFDFSSKRWRNIKIGEKVIKLIEEMKSEDFKKRPSVDNLLDRLVQYCDEMNYSESIDIVPFLKENKVFIQSPINEDLSLIKERESFF